MPKIDTDLWRWYHNVSECHYHIQITIKYRRAVLEPHVIEKILETLKGFKERFAIHIYKIGFDQNHVHILCQFLPTHSGGGCHWHDQEAHGKTVSSNTLSQGATLGRIILDRWLLHRHGQQSRHKGNHYEIH